MCLFMCERLETEMTRVVLRVHVFDAHADGRADAREGINHEADERGVTPRARRRQRQGRERGR
jgi:uncharacterized membrane protein YebE (DUF533 family)